MAKNLKKIVSIIALISVLLGCFTQVVGAATSEEKELYTLNKASDVNCGISQFLSEKNEVLGSFAQLREPADAASEYASIRFISTVEALECACAGFEITVNGKTRTVYLSYAYGEFPFGKELHKASEICGDSAFFISYVLTGIPKSEFNSDIAVRSFFRDHDGTVRYGKTEKGKASDLFGKTVTLVSPPDRTVYYVGAKLDLSGAKIMDNGSGRIIDVDASMTPDADLLTAGEKTVKINYNGAETDFSVTVIERTREFSLNGVFNTHMVLQRNANTPVFGLGSDGDVVTVSFGSQKKSCVVENGKWQISLDPMEANAESQTLSVESAAENIEIICEDVLVGDVWLCSGQSNMFLRVGDLDPYAYENDPYGDDGIIEDCYIVERYYEAFHESANNSLVRSCWQWPGHENVKSEHTSATPYDDILSRMDWVACDNGNPELLDLQSAYAVSFALNIQKEIGVPVGVVCSAQGGTTIKEWLPIDGSETSGIEYYMDGSNYKGNYYNTMIAPMMPFAFKGILWWQGESDALKYGYPEFSTFDFTPENDRYGEHLEKLVNTYREGFTSCVDGSMPFIQSGLVYCSVSGIENLRTAWATFKKRQLSGRYTENIPEAYTTNLWKYYVFGQKDNVHSPRKWECGEASAKTALTYIYGNK